VTRTYREEDAFATAHDLASLSADIVRRGRTEFVGEDRIAQMAAKALVIDLAGACGDLSAFRAANHQLYSDLKRTRDWFAHHYAAADFALVWEILAVEVPLVLERIRAAYPDLED
jgi:uncharacterized protein with HEPN domain